tara:strand:- start:2209 stop:2433 length:225 start_codon:yes stop_codon:yes gene_type:complete
MNRRKRIPLVDISILIITTTVCLTLFVSVTVPLFTGKEYTPEKAQLIAGAFEKLISVVLLAIGAAVQKMTASRD